MKSTLYIKLLTIYLLVFSWLCSETKEDEILISIDFMSLAYESSSIRTMFIGEEKMPVPLHQAEFSKKLKYSGKHVIPVYLKAEDEEPNTFIKVHPKWKEVILLTTMTAENGKKKLVVRPINIGGEDMIKKSPVMIFNAMDIPLYCLFDDESQRISPKSIFDAGLKVHKKRTRLAIGVYSEEAKKSALLFSDRIRLWKDHSLFMIIIKNEFDPNDKRVTDTSAVKVIKVNRYIGGES